MYLLAGDIGGTKTVLGIYPHGGDPYHPLAVFSFPSAEYQSFDHIVERVMAESSYPIGVVAVGVAGPIIDGRVQVTNLPWIIDQSELQSATGLKRAILLNDLESIANAVPILRPEDLPVINPGRPEEGGAKAVIAPGTGLGEAYLTWDGHGYRAHPSEGGHADFAPTNPVELELLEYLRERYEHVSYERLCSGMGIPNIYGYLLNTGRYEEPEWLKVELSRELDPTPIIAGAALNEEMPCRICKTALDIFVSILGSEAGNLALKVLATGGVYLAGGIPPKIYAALRQSQFIDAFCRKGRFSDHMRNIPIYLVRNEHAAMIGAASYALRNWAIESAF
jgi:glucokinase